MKQFTIEIDDTFDKAMQIREFIINELNNAKYDTWVSTIVETDNMVSRGTGRYTE